MSMPTATRRAGGDQPVVDGDGWGGRHVVGLGGLANCGLQYVAGGPPRVGA